MKIKILNIDGFGHFNDKQIHLNTTSINIFLGNNEAGKTTIRNFIKTILFGFPKQRRKEYYPPLNGGKHGGSITIVHTDLQGNENTYIVERFSSDGKAVIRNQEGDTLDPTVLDTILGHTELPVYENIFGFGLTELQDISKLTDKGVEDQIYAAGLGIKQLPDAQKQINNKKRELLQSQAANNSKYKMGQVLNELIEVEQSLTAHQSDLRDLTELEKTIENLNMTINEKKESIEILNSDIIHIGALSKQRDNLFNASQLSEKLSSSFKGKSFPAGDVAKSQELVQSLKTSTQVSDTLFQEIRVIDKDIHAQQINTDIIDDTPEITKFHKNNDSLVKSIEYRATLELASEQLNIDLIRHISDLGHSWTKDKIYTFDNSIGQQAALNEMISAKQSLDTQLSNANQEQDTAQQEVTDAENNLKTKEYSALQGDTQDNAEKALAKRNKLLKDAIDTDQSISRITHQIGSTHPVNSKKPSWIVKILLIVSLVAILSGLWGSWTVFNENTLLGISVLLTSMIILFITMVLVTIFSLRFPTDQSALPDHLTDKRKELNKLEKDFASYKEQLGFDPRNTNTLINEKTAIDKAEGYLNEIKNLQDAVAKRTSNLKDTNANVHSTLEKLSAWEQKWQTWLNDISLPVNTSTDTAQRIFKQIKDAQNINDRLVANTAELNKLAKEISESELALHSLATKHNIRFDPGRTDDLTLIIDELSQKSTDAKMQLQDKNMRQEQRDEKSRNFETENAKIAKITDDLTKLYGQHDDITVEKLYELSEEHRKFVELNNELNIEKANIQSAFNIQYSRQSVNELLKEIGEKDQVMLDQDSHDLTAKKEIILSEIEELESKKATAQHQENDLISSDEASALLAQKETLREDLRVLELDWIKYALAMTMIDKAKARFEEERQPQVMQDASKFFTSVTKNNYKEIRVLPEDKTMVVLASDNTQMQTSELSTGTLEQMLLAVRIGITKEFNERNIALPVVIDDALVNFDPDRQLSTANGFADLAKTNQILVFTCHPETVEVFQKSYPDINRCLL